MPFLAKGFIIFGSGINFKKILFRDKKKNLRLYERLKRRGADVQLIY